MKIFLPFYYLFYSRLRSNISKVAWIFTYIIPIFIVSYLLNIDFIFTSLLIFSIYFTYEIGYIYNDCEVIKKEIKDEVTQILYDRTKRTPIVIPVVNEVTVSTNKKVNAKTESKVEETLAKMPPLRPARISAKDLASDDADDKYTY